jgi:hypothetical protein
MTNPGLISWSLVPGTLLLVARLVYEKAVLEGPQMLLFSFSHEYPLLALWGVLSYYASFVWLGAVVLKAAIGHPRWKLLADLRVVVSVLGFLVAVGLVAGVLWP